MCSDIYIYNKVYSKYHIFLPASPIPSIIIPFPLCDLVLHSRIIVRSDRTWFFGIDNYTFILILLFSLYSNRSSKWNKIFLPLTYRGGGSSTKFTSNNPGSIEWNDNWIIFFFFESRRRRERILKFSQKRIRETRRDCNAKRDNFSMQTFSKKFPRIRASNISKRGGRKEEEVVAPWLSSFRSFTGPVVADNILTSFKSNEVYTHTHTHETRLKGEHIDSGPAHRCTSQAVPIHLIHAPLKKFYSVRFQPSSPSSFAR